MLITSLGQAQLASFGQSLRRLVENWKVCVLLINGVVGAGHAAPRYPTGGNGRSSIFEMITAQPALGKSYAALVDLSLYSSRVPNEILQTQERFDQKSQISILEVLQDRKGRRGGNWALFRTDGTLLIPWEDRPLTGN